MTQRHLEYLASVLSCGAILFGTTSFWGVCLGLASCAPWWALMVRCRMWGLMPANVIGTAAFGINLVRVLLAH